MPSELPHLAPPTCDPGWLIFWEWGHPFAPEAWWIHPDRVKDATRLIGRRVYEAYLDAGRLEYVGLGSAHGIRSAYGGQCYRLKEPT